MTKKWLENDKVKLRAPEPEDLELLYNMENDTTLWSVGDTMLPYSRHTLRAYIEQTRNDLYTEQQARFIIELPSGETAGVIDLADYSPHNGRAEVWLLLPRRSGCRFMLTPVSRCLSDSVRRRGRRGYTASGAW